LDVHQNRRIAIIGGGLSGLATATHLHLADPSLELTIFESSDRVGGVIYTERVGEFLIDHGADMFATQPPAALRLCERLGVAGNLLMPKEQGRGAKIVRRGRLVPIPDGFVLMRATQMWPMLNTPLLSPLGKLRWLAERFVSDDFGDRDVSVGEFVRKRMGDEVLQRLVAPLVAGIYTADVERLSMQATMKNILAMQRQYGSLAKATSVRKRNGDDSVERQSAGARYSQFRAFPGGMGDLIQTLADSLPEGTIRTQCTATAVTAGGQLSFHGSQAPETFDHVVVATPPRVSAKLLADVSPEAAAELSLIESASTAIVVLVVRRSDITRPANSFGFVVPHGEGRSILACSFASEKFPDRAPQDHVIIRVFIGGVIQSPLLQRDDDELQAIAISELRELIGLQSEPVLSRVVRWNNAMPQYQVGHVQRVEKIEREIEKNERISLMSNALHGVGIAPVIASAERLANQITQRAASSRDCS
tara:strand:- start:25830 stop:27260 length:1431 start_codon:yes stop_codon:yes gene_type:complete